MKITDLFSLKDLHKERAAGNVYINSHIPNSIATYTDQCMYNRHWNDVTTNCRGLIYDSKTLDIVARPFRKFFNKGEYPDKEKTFTGPVEVTKKMDGWLGIIYQDHFGEYKVATRGSLSSDVAIHATEKLKEVDFFMPEGYTFCVEIISPETKIIVDYKDMDTLVLTGIINIETGKEIPLSNPNVKELWKGEITEILPFTTDFEAFQYNIPVDEEGIVIHYLDSDERLKIKGEEYKHIARMTQHLSPVSLWRAFQEDYNYDREALLSHFDDFQDWIHSRLDPLWEVFDKRTEELLDSVKQYNGIMDKETAIHLTEMYGKKAPKYINTINHGYKGAADVAWKEVRVNWKNL